MRRSTRRATAPGRARSRALVVAAGLLHALAAPASAQLVQGAVVDVRLGQPVPQAVVMLVTSERDHVAIVMADSAGRYAVEVPRTGEYRLVAQRFGYVDMETPLLRITDDRNYALDLQLQPQPVGLEGIEVTVRNEEVVRWLTREFGENPSSAFGFRVLQGARLDEAKMRGQLEPTSTLRFLYVPVSHGGPCVRINALPRAERSGGWLASSTDFLSAPGAPAGTVERGAAGEEEGDGCGTLMVNDRVIPNALLDTIDMTTVAVVVTLPGLVRMYTYDFDFTFRGR